MNEIMTFRSVEFGAIRTMSNEQGAPIFCAKDVAEALGYKLARKAIQDHVEEDDVLKRNLIDSLGRKQRAIFINESGLYALILSSKLESAKRFKRWVTGEVLPAIRKQGGYLLAKQGESEQEVMTRAMEIVKTTLTRRDEQIARLKPRAEYADSVLDSINCITTTQLAKELGMSAQELNRRLCEMRIQYWQSGQYMLYADFARQGFAKSRTRRHVCKHGIVMTEMYLVWTERGRNFIHQLLDSKFAN
ncbi:MAG: phage antirepressor KilAC domain-containing protein [Bacteroidaceae bacterium]|nr:phage antirepressor KilAC domain-containing protein [Bacteroidaceae bacterium]